MKIHFNATTRIFFTWIFPALWIASASASAELTYIPEPPAISWTYTDSKSGESVAILDSAPLWRQLPKSMRCCIGFYTAKVDIEKLRSHSSLNKNVNLSMLLPGVPGLEKVLVNGQEVFTTVHDYSMAGPVISLPALERPVFELLIYISAPRSIFTGLSYRRLTFGSYDHLSSKREWGLVREKYLPLFLFSVFIFLGAAVFWSGYLSENDDPLIVIFIEVIIIWALFYFSLSGLLRVWFPSFGGFIHLILRSLAGLASVRLLRQVMQTPQLEMRNETLTCLGVIFFGAVMSLSGDFRFQWCGYIYTTILYFFAVFQYWKFVSRHQNVSVVEWTIVVSSSLFAIGNAFDSIKLTAEFLFMVRVPYPYFNRFFDPPLVLSTVVYLATQAAKSALYRQKNQATRTLADQLLHDLRSPVASIRNLIEFQKGLGMDDSVYNVVKSATKQITEICESLEAGGSTSNDLKICNLIDLLNEEIARKRAEFPLVNITLKNEEEQKRFVEVQEVDFKRMISNIINNAAKALCDFGQLEIRTTDKGRFHKVVLKDYGDGMCPAAIMQFSKIGSVKKDVGVGLGLSHANRMVKLWHGKITIISRDPIGTEVSIILPKR